MLDKGIKAAIQRALEEDIGSGDVTSIAIIPPTQRLRGELLVKAPGVIAGLEVARQVFISVDAEILFHPLVKDGSHVYAGQIAAELEGQGPGMLTAERTALNFLQRMSGIATATARYVEEVKDTQARILDTRKTAPGLRAVDKLAVRLGGATNHRMGLYDMVLIKDNHIQAAGSITRAVQSVRQRSPHLPIEVEVETLQQLQEALSLDVDRIMLDNMSLDMMREAVRITAGRCELEASGGIHLQTVRAVAETGVDYISVGSLTHSVQALDISLEITLL